MWWHSPGIPAHRTWSQEDEKLKVILDYVTSSRSSWVYETLSQKQNEDANSQKGISRLSAKKLPALKCRQCSAWRTESMQSHPKSRQGLLLVCFSRNKRIFPNIYMKSQETNTGQNNTKERSWRSHTSRENLVQRYNFKTTWCVCADRHRGELTT